ncbi:vesicle transporter SFT2A [Thecamonas trahens ATCC 50062]|uniref:Vesicle transport protein n=1 Tax=Thecamonas trahens ATCC 50062 TaxID=461836 RepID=A0A0L0D642_THETB|nr:vesicle transporter SFT2A [Thecamonas trahens ATCC 50062]KNC46783.1 vesicle transporter SFT2A [Thecamonas trahens ATCC 50062]|eukprot:XP_013760060.1 vesicle transporter SFT2A [Thecamonas trahens ATCC 50062]
MSAFKNLLGGKKEEEKTFVDDMRESCKLSYRERLYGFGIMFSVGCVLGIMSTFFVWDIPKGKPAAFAITYSLGSLCAIGSSAFLAGPWKQIKSMMKETRIIASSVYVVAIGFTLYFALGPNEPVLVLMCIIIQFLAGIWYCLSYIPYARRCVKSTLGGMVGV